MKITVTECRNGSFRAELEGLPGSPPVGIRRTPEDAVAMLFALLIHESRERNLWIDCARKLLDENSRVIVKVVRLAPVEDATA